MRVILGLTRYEVSQSERKLEIGIFQDECVLLKVAKLVRVVDNIDLGVVRIDKLECLTARIS